MNEPMLNNEVRHHRERLGLSQQALASLIGVSRQAIVGIEAARQVPATTLALRLARALRCGVDELFTLSDSGGLAARLARGGARRVPAPGGRVVLGEVDGAWVAHALPSDGTSTADGVVTGHDPGGGSAAVRPLIDPEIFRRNVFVSGCAPILGMLSQRVGSRFADARATWLPGDSSRSLELLKSRLIHVAGVHLSGSGADGDHEAIVRSAFRGERMLIANLTRWRVGFVVPTGNPLDIRGGEDLLRGGLRFVRRDEGSGAHRIVSRLLASAGAGDAQLSGPEADGHLEVAQLVRCGAADVGVAIEGAALSAGLGFVPLIEERFDLVVPASIADGAPVARLLDSLDDRSFRADLAHVPGYDTALSGHVTTLEAA